MDSEGLSRTISFSVDLGAVEPILQFKVINYLHMIPLWGHAHGHDCSVGSALWTNFISQQRADMYAEIARQGQSNPSGGLYNDQVIDMIKDNDIPNPLVNRDSLHFSGKK